MVLAPHLVELAQDWTGFALNVVPDRLMDLTPREAALMAVLELLAGTAGTSLVPAQLLVVPADLGRDLIDDRSFLRFGLVHFFFDSMHQSFGPVTGHAC
jgi:hypothetical protein